MPMCLGMPIGYRGKVCATLRARPAEAGDFPEPEPSPEPSALNQVPVPVVNPHAEYERRLAAWRECGVTTMICSLRQPDVLRILAEAP